MPDPPAWPPAATLALSDADKLRQAVWADDSLREAFIASNPEALPAADLDLVASWRQCIAGAFFVLRHLKKHSVFLTGGAPARPYGVVGLLSTFEEVVGKCTAACNQPISQLTHEASRRNRLATARTSPQCPLLLSHQSG